MKKLEFGSDMVVWYFPLQDSNPIQWDVLYNQKNWYATPTIDWE